MRLGQRVIQVDSSIIILTGAAALNKVCHPFPFLAGTSRSLVGLCVLVCWPARGMKLTSSLCSNSYGVEPVAAKRVLAPACAC